MSLMLGIGLLSTVAGTVTVILLFLSLRASVRAVLRQLRFEMGLLLLATVAMIASMVVPPASGSEKTLVLLSVYSGAMLLVAGTVRLAMLWVKTLRTPRQTSGRR